MTTILIILTPYYNMMTPLTYLYIRNSGCTYSVSGEMGYIVCVCVCVRVSLFGLSARRTNLMGPAIEFIRLILPTSYKTFS